MCIYIYIYVYVYVIVYYCSHRVEWRLEGDAVQD